ncbi:MAG: reverse transcriptase domain-containing protein [Candidatus Acidiferrum sp.]
MTDKVRVTKHAFFPLMEYVKRQKRYAKPGEDRKTKDRPIRYAARLDSYIFSYYRHILLLRYERELTRLGLSSSVLAYRHIDAGDGKTGKCNIHFARDAFSKIRELGDCCVLALDISSYFESLDHNRLKELWSRLLGTERLPADHFQVYGAMTRYSLVDKLQVYERLGHFGIKDGVGNGESRKGFLTPYSKIPKCLCRGREFREKIAGSSSFPSLITTNPNDYGIPQGAPLSDLLANLYLVDFDERVAGWVQGVGGAYFRYSDDILIIAPGGEPLGRDLMSRTTGLIKEYGRKLEIKEQKTSLFVFERCAEAQSFRRVEGQRGRNGLEYLGFRYDGRKVYLRDATMANFCRKIVRRAYREADACARRYPDNGVAGLKSLFNYEKLIQSFGRVRDFGESRANCRRWTFWTYARRASEVLGPMGEPIMRQLRRHREFIMRRADEALELAVLRRGRRKSPCRA